MNTVSEIQQAILELPESDYIRLIRWFHELDWEQWDLEITEDAQNGKLDSLVVQAKKSREDGTLREL